MKTAAHIPHRLPGTFDELARIMVPHAIADDVDYDNTVELVNRLAVLAKLTKGQRQYLDTLTLLIEAYDKAHNAIDYSNIGPLEILKSLLNAHGMNASDLGRLLGNRELGSKILRGERQLSKVNIRQLSERFKLSPAAFMD